MTSDEIVAEFTRMQNEIAFLKGENETLRIQRSNCIIGVRDMHALLAANTGMRHEHLMKVSAAMHNLRCTLHIQNLYDKPAYGGSTALRETFRKMGIEA